MQTYGFRFPNDEEASSAQALLAEQVAAANGTMRVAPGFCYGLAYLVVNLPGDANPVETLSPFIEGYWWHTWEVERDSLVTDEEVELTAQQIADVENS